MLKDDAGERPDPTETRGWERIRKIWEETARGRLSIPRSTRDLPAIPRLTPILSFSLSSTQCYYSAQAAKLRGLGEVEAWVASQIKNLKVKCLE